MRKKYEVPVIDIVEIGVMCLLSASGYEGDDIETEWVFGDGEAAPSDAL